MAVSSPSTRETVQTRSLEGPVSTRPEVGASANETTPLSLHASAQAAWPVAQSNASVLTTRRLMRAIAPSRNCSRWAARLPHLSSTERAVVPSLHSTRSTWPMSKIRRRSQLKTCLNLANCPNLANLKSKVLVLARKSPCQMIFLMSES